LYVANLEVNWYCENLLNSLPHADTMHLYSLEQFSLEPYQQNHSPRTALLLQRVYMSPYCPLTELRPGAAISVLLMFTRRYHVAPTNAALLI